MHRLVAQEAFSEGKGGRMVRAEGIYGHVLRQRKV